MPHALAAMPSYARSVLNMLTNDGGCGSCRPEIAETTDPRTSLRMSRQRPRDTGAEWTLRRLLHSRGLLQISSRPQFDEGKPEVLLGSRSSHEVPPEAPTEDEAAGRNLDVPQLVKDAAP